MISFGGQEIPKSPYEINVGPFKESKIRAFGPGLHGGVVNKPACFTVETNGETGALGMYHKWIAMEGLIRAFVYMDAIFIYFVFILP